MNPSPITTTLSLSPPQPRQDLNQQVVNQARMILTLWLRAPRYLPLAMTRLEELLFELDKEFALGTVTPPPQKDSLPPDREVDVEPNEFLVAIAKRTPIWDK